MSKLTRYKLSDLYEMSSGISSTKEQAGHGYPFVSFSTVFNNFFLPEELPDLMDTSSEEQETFSVKKDDVFITRTSETVDALAKSCVAVKDYPKATFSGFVKRLRPKKKGIVYSRYIAFFLRSKYFRKVLDCNTIMTLRASFNEDIFSFLYLYLPNYEEQVRIGDFLYKIEMKIRKNNKINDNLLATTQAIYKSWFVDFEPFDNVCPSDWGNGCVDDIAEFYDSMRKPLSSLERADMERIYPYYGAVSIVDYVDDFIFDGEYLLLSEDGIYVVDENGHPLLQHITGKFWANNHAHILKGKSGFNEDSLYLFLANTNMAPIVTGAAQPKINQANLKSFSITIPTSEVIENFNALIQPFFDQRLSNEAEVKKLESLKDLLLSRLVN